MTRILLLLLTAITISTTGCSTVYYNFRESMGTHKREILQDRVLDARDEQEKAKEQFKDALEQFRSVVNVEGGSLQQKYDTLSAEYESSKSRAQKVSDRIDSIEDVAEALFAEWKKELDAYSSDRLRQNSERQLNDTRARYLDLIGAMKKAESRMEPVLEAFEDQVLYLKHNLNAAAIASLQGEVIELESEIDQLIKDMESSINEANDFITHMEGQGQGGEVVG